jgi:hypothetical protein
MIYDWRFRAVGRQAALFEGTVHGREDLHGCLYDTARGKLLKEWAGKGDVPDWAAGLRKK